MTPGPLVTRRRSSQTSSYPSPLIVNPLLRISFWSVIGLCTHVELYTGHTSVMDCHLKDLIKCENDKVCTKLLLMDGDVQWECFVEVYRDKVFE